MRCHRLVRVPQAPLNGRLPDVAHKGNLTPQEVAKHLERPPLAPPAADVPDIDEDDDEVRRAIRGKNGRGGE